MSDWDFFRRVLIVAAVIAFAALIWQLSQVALLFFGAVLVSLLLSGPTDYITRHTPLSRWQALLLTNLALLALLAGIIVLFGTQIVAQVTDLAQRLPGALDNFEHRFQLGDVSGKLAEQMRSNSGALLFQITSIAAFVLSITANAILVLIAGAFLAAQPQLYFKGGLQLVPPQQREVVAETMMDAGAALKQWLIAQIAAMAIVGTLSGVGLWLVGLPSPLALGLIAATTEFVPIIGPILGAIPALLLAMTVDTQTFIWTAGVILVVQQLEANVITPMLQQRMVSLPPVLTTFAIVFFGLLFGPLGLVLATPLAVMTMVLVTRLYIRELLDEHAKVPGEKEAAASAAAAAAASPA